VGGQCRGCGKVGTVTVVDVDVDGNETPDGFVCDACLELDELILRY
jgi:hypothetical protein